MNDSDLSGTSSLTTDLQVLHHKRLKDKKNLMIGYLNINSLRNKLTDLKLILKYLSLDYFVLSETKWYESFPNARFNLDCYEIRARRDINNSRDVLSSMFEKVLSLRKCRSFSVSIDPELRKI